MIIRYAIILIIMASAFLGALPAAADELNVDVLVAEALAKSPELMASSLRADALRHRVLQAGALPDPMLMFGYQNEGYKRYTYGEMQGAQWMYSASQMFPFPGKLGLKEEMAIRDAEAQTERLRNLKLKIAARVKETYFDLFLAHKTVSLVRDRIALYEKIEQIALARYATGTGMQQDVLMAQTEKYMLHEREEMLQQRIRSLEAMLTSLLGREAEEPFDMPLHIGQTTFGIGLNELLENAYNRSPELRARRKMVDAADAKVRMTEKEYYPDFTITATLMERPQPFEDMWSLTTSFNIPIFYRSKQRQAVLEAKASLSEAEREYEAARLMIAAAVRDNFSMLKSAERLMDLYRTGLAEKAAQEYESALALYTAGSGAATNVYDRLKGLIDADIQFWTQFSEREKAIARLEAIAVLNPTYMGGVSQ